MTGKFKFYNRKAGYGLIDGEDGQVYFAGWRSITQDSKCAVFPITGTKCEFNPEVATPKGKYLNASKVKLVFPDTLTSEVKNENYKADLF
ncbi:MAG: hypothetical protein P9L88_04645 [Candidatus Tantalella remota]|nr:hypothetical protein [Candidatus Tantalella remota]